MIQERCGERMLLTFSDDCFFHGVSRFNGRRSWDILQYGGQDDHLGSGPCQQNIPLPLLALHVSFLYLTLSRLPNHTTSLVSCPAAKLARQGRFFIFNLIRSSDC
jgi:hypothetical protein